MRPLRTWAGRLTTRWDAALTLFFATIAIGETLTSGSTADPELRAGAAAITAIGLLFRRKLPLVTAAIVSFGLTTESLLLESPDEIGVLLVIVVASFSIAAYAPPRDALIGLAMLSLAIALAVATDPSDTYSNILPTLLLFMVLPGGLGLILHRRHRDIAALQLEATALANEADQAIDAERRRIARELHDVVSHAVTLIAVQSEAAQSVLDRDTEAARRSLVSIGAASRDALAELDRMLGLLRESTHETSDAGISAIPALASGARAAGMVVDVAEHGERPAVSPVADHTTYRVVQEGLTNALRHASGSTVKVDIHYAHDLVRIDVTSVGSRPGSAYGGAGRGLAGLRERVLGLGGSLDTATSADGDFGLHVTLPTVVS